MSNINLGTPTSVLDNVAALDTIDEASSPRPASPLPQSGLETSTSTSPPKTAANTHPPSHPPSTTATRPLTQRAATAGNPTTSSSAASPGNAATSTRPRTQRSSTLPAQERHELKPWKHTLQRTEEPRAGLKRRATTESERKGMSAGVWRGVWFD